MMGLNRVPALHQYWNCKDLYYNRAIASKIPRDRFIAILKYIHFVENQPESTTTTRTSQSFPLPLDRLWKLWPVISAVLDACRGNYHPHREQAIDEAMVGFKGRSCITQYLPKKPIKREFKIWIRADSHNGYLSQFDCYKGKTRGAAEVGLGHPILPFLPQPCLNCATPTLADNKSHHRQSFHTPTTNLPSHNQSTLPQQIYPPATNPTLPSLALIYR